MRIDTSNINTLWASLLVEELVRNGVRTFCLSPGSRCSPLTVAVARHSRTRALVHFDERGAAYHALGIAKAAGTPVALVCTSGTAAANYLPAAVEASQACVPLILLTADRPPDLLDAGANQTIRQHGLYGDYVRWFHQIPCPDRAIPPEALLTAVDQAVYRAWRAPAGPVHLNCLFREPLAPTPAKDGAERSLEPLRKWIESGEPYTSYTTQPTPKVVLDSGQQRRIDVLLNRVNRGLLMVGELRSPMEVTAASYLASVLGWPVLPAIGSGLRLGWNGPPWVPCFDTLLHSARVQSRLAPDTVLHIGGAFTSKRLEQFLTAYPPAAYIHVASHPFRSDPVHRVTHRVESDLLRFCEWQRQANGTKADDEWAQLAQACNKAADDAIEQALGNGGAWDEAYIARQLSRMIPDDHALFLGNSMPIRDMEQFGAADGARVRVLCNRGASGIDGNIATAAGIARGTGGPVTAVLGDLAILHDLNALALFRTLDIPVILIGINNDGGGIFSFLPIAGFEDVFEKFFTTPHGLHFRDAAALFRLEYYRADDGRSFEQAYREAVRIGRPAFIEAVVDRATNVQSHRRLRQAVLEAVEQTVQ